MSATNAAAREIELVVAGYTVSNRIAAIGRIGANYVMRDCDGNRVVLPLSTKTDRLLAAWTALCEHARSPRPTATSALGLVPSASAAAGAGCVPN